MHNIYVCKVSIWNVSCQVHGKQHSFSIYDRIFLWKCRSIYVWLWTVNISLWPHQMETFSALLLTVCSDADQRKHQSSASLAFVRGIHRLPVDSLHKGPVTRKCFHLMTSSWLSSTSSSRIVTLLLADTLLQFVVPFSAFEFKYTVDFTSFYPMMHQNGLRLSYMA